MAPGSTKAAKGGLGPPRFSQIRGDLEREMWRGQLWERQGGALSHRLWGLESLQNGTQVLMTGELKT